MNTLFLNIKTQYCLSKHSTNAFLLNKDHKTSLKEINTNKK